MILKLVEFRKKESDQVAKWWLYDNVSRIIVKNWVFEVGRVYQEYELPWLNLIVPTTKKSGESVSGKWIDFEKERLPRSVGFDDEVVCYILNDEGKTIERITAD